MGNSDWIVSYLQNFMAPNIYSNNIFCSQWEHRKAVRMYVGGGGQQGQGIPRVFSDSSLPDHLLSVLFSYMFLVCSVERNYSGNPSLLEYTSFLFVSISEWLITHVMPRSQCRPGIVETVFSLRVLVTFLPMGKTVLGHVFNVHLKHLPSRHFRTL